ncbi:MAG TPA: pitrilysin family protein [Thermohalobaculum sp.]|nr:pitrilysin family protein [Thermohalobaculum sp.]
MMTIMRFFGPAAAAFTVAVGLAGPAAAIDIQELESPGGIDYWLVEEHSIPIVALEVEFGGGARLDPEDRLGIAEMVAGLLDEGAGELDALAFAKARDDLSARYSFSAGRDGIDVSARMLSEKLEPSVALLASALAEPRFDEEPVGRVRKQLLSNIAERSTDPNAIAGETWFGRAFPDHPYGRPASGTAETVAAIDVPDLEAAHDRLLTRSNATVGIVGDVTPAEADAMVDTLFAGLPEGEPLAEETAEGTPPPGVEVIELAKPQSVAIFGHKGLAREDDDFIPAYVLNYILGGGGFESRLMEEVREKRGLAYSVSTSMLPLDQAALYIGSVSTANARMGESLDVIRGEWKRLAEEGPTAEELEAAKKYLTGAFPLRFDSNAKIAGYLVFLQKEELGAGYIDTRNDMIEAVTLEDARRVARRLYAPDALSIVVVGQPEGV